MDEHPRQPNDQGRVVAPPITGNKLKVIYFTRFWGSFKDNFNQVFLLKWPFLIMHKLAPLGKIIAEITDLTMRSYRRLP